MTGQLAYANPEVLRWARDTAGLSVQEAAAKIGIQWMALDMVEDGAEYLTLRQAERAADVYERPLAALLLPSPPAEPTPDAVFRRLPGAPAPPWPSEMRLLARRVRARQEAAAELYEDLDERPPWRAAAERLRDVKSRALAGVTRELLGVSRDEQKSWARADDYAPLRGWVDAVETLGVLVMQDGSMPLEVMRGFASMNDAVPAIVVNSADDPRARAFTVLHELGHLAFAAAGLGRSPRGEARANDFAGEVVMPRAWLAEEIEAVRGRPLLSIVDAVSRKFGVTPLNAAVRIRRADLAPSGEAEGAIAAIQARRTGARREASGGHYYPRTIARLGPSFIRLVFSALDSQTLTYPTASTLLGNVNVDNFAKLRDALGDRGAVR